MVLVSYGGGVCLASSNVKSAMFDLLSIGQSSCGKGRKERKDRKFRTKKFDLKI